MKALKIYGFDWRRIYNSGCFGCTQHNIPSGSVSGGMRHCEIGMWHVCAMRLVCCSVFGATGNENNKTKTQKKNKRRAVPNCELAWLDLAWHGLGRSNVVRGQIDLWGFCAFVRALQFFNVVDDRVILQTRRTPHQNNRKKINERIACATLTGPTCI